MHQLHTRLRVLVVEDCRDTAESLQILLGLWGHDVCIASDGCTALDVAQSFAPHVILLDIGLPRLDGFTVARRLKEMPSLQVPLVVAATGYDGASFRTNSHQAGFDCILPKPFDLQVLRELLASSRQVVPAS
jgi:CheY-like chemotaxis protein